MAKERVVLTVANRKWAIAIEPKSKSSQRRLAKVLRECAELIERWNAPVRVYRRPKSKQRRTSMGARP